MFARDFSRATSALSQLRQRLGWRFYALPALVVATIAVAIQMAMQKAPAVSRTTAAAPSVGDHQSQLFEGFDSGASTYRPATTTPATQLNLPAESTTCLTNQYRQLIIVSIRRQHLWACHGRRQVAATAVTTGETDNGDDTPLGSWRVQAKQRNRYLVGPGYRDFVQYWVPFNGDFGFHDASWQTMPFGSQDYHTRGSHGCVHLPTQMMKWLYRWATVADTVVTIEA